MCCKYRLCDCRAGHTWGTVNRNIVDSVFLLFFFFVVVFFLLMCVFFVVGGVNIREWNVCVVSERPIIQALPHPHQTLTWSQLNSFCSLCFGCGRNERERKGDRELHRERERSPVVARVGECVCVRVCVFVMVNQRQHRMKKRRRRRSGGKGRGSKSFVSAWELVGKNTTSKQILRE